MLNQNLENVTFCQNEYQSYAQHLVLPEVGLEGQKRLKQARVLCIGAGGLGSCCLLYLAAAGVGNIGIVDHDIVEQSNLQRQIIYQFSNVGYMKVDCAQENIQKINPHCIVETYNDFLDLHNIFLIVPKYDLVIDGSDNLQTKYVIGNACKIFNKPHVYGAVMGFTGQIGVFNYQGGPSYQDLYPMINQNNALVKCAGGGVLGTLPGIIGILQATEVIKIVVGMDSVFSESILIYNALDVSFKKIRLRKKTVSIYTYKRYNDLLIYTNNSELIRSMCKAISVNHFDNTNKSGAVHARKPEILLLDVRSPVEYQLGHIKTSINIPLRRLTNKEVLSFLRNESRTKHIYIYCSMESRSVVALSLLRKHKIIGYRLSAEISKSLWGERDSNPR